MRPLFCSLILTLACTLFAPPATAEAYPPRYRNFYAPTMIAPGVRTFPQVNTTPNYWAYPYSWYGYGYPYGYSYGSYYYPGSFNYWATPFGSSYYYTNPGNYWWYRTW